MTDDIQNDNSQETNGLDKEYEHIFALKDQIANILHGNNSNDCFIALRMMVVQFLCDTCTSKDFAIEMLAEMTASSIPVIQNMDELGLCSWNKTDSTLQ